MQDVIGNRIHPTAILDGGVTLGANNVVLPYTILTGPLDIGDDNIIGPHTVIGSPGQDTRNPRYDSSRSHVRIGSRNIIREHVAIQKPCYGDITSIGDDTYIMHNAHIAHDTRIEDKAVVTVGVVLAGLVHVLEGASLGLGCLLHQHCVVGQYAMAAMGAVVTKNIRPFSRYIPGQPTSVNLYAVRKFGFEALEEDITSYVLHRTQPASPILTRMVDHYLQASHRSQRPEYG